MISRRGGSDGREVSSEASGGEYRNDSHDIIQEVHSYVRMHSYPQRAEL